MICYGVNSGVGFGGNSNCAGLACKLATPGCTTDAFGGNCVGTVVPFGSKEAVHPESQKFVGAPCLDATPSDTTLDRTGAPASGEEGLYMGKLWTVCDCAEGGTGLPEPASRLLNLTTSRISNFTKNEVLAAFSTFLPQKNVTDESNGKDKVVTLLPSFADMFRLPSLSSINLPSILGDLTGAKGGKDGQSVSGPKLPDLSGLLGQMKPAADSQPQTSAAIQGVLNPEAGSLPNGTKVELMGSTGAAPAPPAEKPPRTLGSLLSRFTKPKNDSSSSHSSSSAAAPGADKTDASATKVKPMTLGDLFGGLRRAGPDSNSTAAPAAAATAPAGNSTRKLDLSPIGALINKFINGPNAAPPAAPAAAATTTAAPASAPAQQQQPLPATAAKIQSTPQPSQQPAPAAAPAAAAPTPPATPAPRAPGPATLTVPKSGKISYVAPTAGAPPPELDLTPITAGHTPGDPNDRPKTLAERLREKKKAQQGATKVVDVTDSPKAGPSADAPIPPPSVRKSGFSASVPGLNLPPVKRLQDDPVWIATGMDSPTLMLNLQALTNALQSGAGAGAEDLMQFGALLGQLQKVPGGLGALPADVSTALMTLAAEVNRVTSGGAPAAAAPEPAAATPAPAPAAAQPADKAADKPAAADKVADKPAAAAPAADKAADKPAAAAPAAAAPAADKAADKPAAAAPAADKAADKPAAAVTPAPAAQSAKQAADKPAAAPASVPAPAKPADADKKEQPQQQQQQPVKASLASTPDNSSGSSSSKKDTPATAPTAAAAASKEAVKQPAQAAAPAATGAAAAPAAGKSEAPDSKKDSPSQPAPAGAAAKPAPAAAEDKPAAAAAAASKPASTAAPAAAAAGSVKAPAAAASPSEQPKAVSKQQ
jgi:hypothetical protein